MKKRTKIIIGLATLCAAAASASLAACSVWDTPYDQLNNIVRVLYDINGGQFASSSNVNIVDGISVDDALKGVKLYEPGSDARGDDASYSIASRSGYFLEGWYSSREPRVDAKGNSLDEDGNLCSQSNKEQGYTYSGKWDFDKDLFKIKEGEYKTDDVEFTLYAAWIPNFSFNFHTKENGSWKLSASYVINPTLQSLDLELPYWADEQPGANVEECTGAMTYGNFPQIENKTFNKIYWDSSLQNEITSSYITHTGSVNEATGTVDGSRMNFYLDMLDGVWFHIYTVDQFIANSRIDGCYDIRGDFDFKDKNWNLGLAVGDFTGKIIGHGHAFSNITVTQTNYSQLRGGVFGRIMASAELKDITFSNVTYNLNAASRLNGGEFGLFAGNIDKDAKLENVNVTGTLHIGDVYNTNYSYYSVGLLCSNVASLNLSGLTYDIGCVVDLVKDGTREYYPNKATVEANGTVTLSANPDPSKDPN